jgi:hypothetical protein
MSKFENVLKAQKVRERRRTRTDDDDDNNNDKSARRGYLSPLWDFFFLSSLDGEENFGSSLLFRENDLIFVSLTLSLLSFQFTPRANETVLPAATQTRALERHNGYDLLGRDSVGDDRGCVWNARHGVEGFSDRVEQETGLLKKKKRKRIQVVSLDYKYKTRILYTTIKH